MAKPPKPTVPPPALRSQGQAQFSANFEANLVYQQTQADYMEATNDFVDATNDTVAANAVAANLGDVDFSTIPNQLLGVNGTGDGVEGVEPAGLSPVTLLSTIVLSGQTEIDFTQFDNSAFASYRLEFSAVRPSVDADLRMRTSSNGGSTFENGGSAYDYNNHVVQGGADSFLLDGANDFILLADGILTSNAVWSISGEMKIFGAEFGESTVAQYHLTYTRTGQTTANVWGSGLRNFTEITDAIRMYLSTGNFASGRITFYGIRR